MLQVRELSVELSRAPVVSEVSFDIAAGSITGLTGDSGCGKTTLALALLGLLPADRFRVRGSVRLRDRELLPLPERQWERVRGGQISMVFQDPLQALNPVLRVGTQLAEAMRAHGKSSDIGHLLQMVELPEAAQIRDAYPHQLSGGERQRVCLALALSAAPGLVIADEPFTALDAPRVVELARLFWRLKEKLGTACLLISHSAGVLAKLADRVLVMDGGRVHGR